jgi:hypothetical protein
MGLRVLREVWVHVFMVAGWIEKNNATNGFYFGGYL